MAFGFIIAGLTCFTILILPNECQASAEEMKLIHDLLADYNPVVRPVDHYSDIVTVNFSLALQQIIDLDEKNQLLTTSIYMNTAWKDAHLRWDPASYGHITSIRLPAKSVWKPDILVYNSAADSFDQLKQTNVIVQSNGNVEWLPPGIFKTTCDVDILYFPFDEQKCTLKFGAWTHHGNLVDLNVLYDGVADTSAYHESGEWDLLSMIGKRNSRKYDCCADPFVDSTFTIHIRRKTVFYQFNLILPCVLVCSLTILIFVLPADSGERMTLGITVLLAMVVFLQIVADNLPPTGVIPLLGEYFANSIIMVTLSVILSVFSMNLHHTTSANGGRMPIWLEFIFLRFLAKMLCMTMPKTEQTQNEFELSPNGVDGQPLVRVGERLGGWHGESHDNKDPATSLAMQLKHSEKQIAKICGDLHDVAQRIRDDEEDEAIAMKWRCAARVLDRFCLVFFIIFFILSTLLTIGTIPGVLTSKPE